MAKLASDKSKGYDVSPNTVKKVKDLMVTLSII
jgi:hypothetical protein